MAERAFLVIGSGLFVGVLGILIRYAGMMHLIAGYDPDQVVDDEGLANFIGAQTLIVAVLTVCVGLLELWGPQPTRCGTGWCSCSLLSLSPSEWFSVPVTTKPLRIRSDEVSACRGGQNGTTSAKIRVDCGVSSSTTG